MSSNTNAINPYANASLEQVQEALGLTVFDAATGENWYHTIAGLLIQGGVVGPIAGNTLSGLLPFNTGFPKQVLGVFLQPIDTVVAGTGIRYSAAVSVPDLNNFQIANDGAVAVDFYWWAIGL
jgi:hypothetical protein